MENFEQTCEDLKYLVCEIHSTVDRNRFYVPEDFYKVILDLCYHAKNSIKEMEKDYEQFVKTWNDSDS